jgi:hypothetical protein
MDVVGQQVPFLDPALPTRGQRPEDLVRALRHREQLFHRIVITRSTAS